MWNGLSCLSSETANKGIDETQLAQDGVQWQVIVNTVINIWLL
jgi:hypothetical protein